MHRMSQKDVFGLEIAMNDFMTIQKNETAQQLLGEASNDFQRETTEVVSLDELVKIHVQEICRNAKVTTEVKALIEIHNTVFVFWIPLAQLLQDIDFH